MHILIVNHSFLPAVKYGGTERVIWWLGKALVAQGHKVSYLVSKGSHCTFANVLLYNESVPFNTLVPADVDVVHLNHCVNEVPTKPYIFTVHGNANHQQELDINSVFVSADHAARYGSTVYVHNSIDPDDYGKPDFEHKANYIHFLGDAAWRVKNVVGAIKVASMANIPLKVLGGVRFNFNQGLRFTFNRNVRFKGMVGGHKKNELLKRSSAMLFPVRWSEPFGLAIIESLYFGCPVFGTPYGSLPELVPAQVGFLSNKSSELAAALQNRASYSSVYCHQYVMDNFTSRHMMAAYMQLYEKVLSGKTLNQKSPALLEVQAQKFLYFD